MIDRGAMVLQSIATHPDQRGRGLGRRLVGALLAAGRAEGAEWAILNVDAANAPALALYRGLGFTAFGHYAYMQAPAR